MLMFAVLARERGRLFGLSLLSLLSLIQSAHANGVSGTITDGKTVTGTISASGHDDYSFSATQGATFIVSLGETGTHDQLFRPQLEVIPPGATSGPYEARPYYTNRVVTKAAAGNWTLRVSRLDSGNSSGGSYALKLAVVGSGAQIAAGQDKSGTNTRGGIDVYTFAGTAGHSSHLTLTPTSHNKFVPEIYVFGPDGAQVSGVYCAAKCSFDVPTANGTYTVMALKHDDHDVTGSYALSVSNAN